jgi:polyferredoxin
LRPRVLVYTSILMSLIIAVGVSLAMRTPFKVDVVRDRATMARITENGGIENIYRLQVMNAAEVDKTYQLSVAGMKDIEIATEKKVNVAAAQAHWVVLRVTIPYGSAEAGSHKIVFDIKDTSGSDVIHEKSVFLVPR